MPHARHGPQNLATSELLSISHRHRGSCARISTPEDKVLTVQVPWAQPQSGFTLLRETDLLSLVKVMAVSEVKRLTGISDDRLWHLIRTRVEDAWDTAEWKGLERLGVDEASPRKGHKYGTAFVVITGKQDASGKGAAKVARLLFFTPRKGKETFKEFVGEFDRRQTPRETICEVAMDMSRAFMAGAREYFPDAQICFDHLPVMKLCGQAVDSVRKQAAQESGGLAKGALWVLRGNPDRLSKDQRQLRENLCREHRSIVRALSIRALLTDLWKYADLKDAKSHFDAVLSWRSRSRLQSFVELGRSLRCHRDGILGSYQHYTTSAALEALNGLPQLARRRARGYCSFRNFRALSSWMGGRLVPQNGGAFTH